MQIHWHCIFDDVGIATLDVAAYRTAQARAYQLRAQRYYIRPAASLPALRETVLGLRGLGVEATAQAVCEQAQNRYRSDAEMTKEMRKLCGSE